MTCSPASCDRSPYYSGFKQHIDWDVENDDDNCINCQHLCINDESCGAVECGDGECIWWAENTCTFSTAKQNGWSTDDALRTCFKQNAYTLGISTISAGSNHVCAIDTSDQNKVHCWGDDTYDQCLVPRGGFFGELIFESISAGEAHTCGIVHSGHIRCWGDNRDGQVSDRPLGDEYAQISVSGYTSCALNTSRKVTCWGSDAENKLWINDHQDDLEFISISCGKYHCCGIAVIKDEEGNTSDFNKIECWGWGHYTEPTLPSSTNEHWVIVSSGEYFSCALSKTGKITCFGDDMYGQVSNVPEDSRGYFVVSCGDSRCCAISKHDYGIECWGDSWDYLSYTVQYGDWSALSLGENMGCAKEKTNVYEVRITCWGDDWYYDEPEVFKDPYTTTHTDWCGFYGCVTDTYMDLS
eukprot:UN31792